jgi:phosphatidylglycerol:prolipoprotein diacylglycerol transferase
MLPVLFRFEWGGHLVTVGSYAVFMTLAWIEMVAVGTLVAVRRGMAWRRVLVVFGGALLGGVVGARLLDVATSSGQRAGGLGSAVLSLNFQGFSLYGGLLLGALTAIVLARTLGLRVWRFADAALPGLCVGIALMRVGCFLRGCCFGEPTTLPWGVTFPTGSPAWAQQLLSGQTGVLGMAGAVQAVHPTQLYEMAAALLLCAGALTWRRWRRLPDGSAFLAFAIGFTVFRVGNGFLRVRVAGAAPPWFDLALYGVVIVVSAVLLGWRFADGRAPAARPQATWTISGPPPLPWETSRVE